MYIYILYMYIVTVKQFTVKYENMVIGVTLYTVVLQRFIHATFDPKPV